MPCALVIKPFARDALRFGNKTLFAPNSFGITRKTFLSRSAKKVWLG